MKWNYEKLPQRDSDFCEDSQEIVEFHVVYVTLLVFAFQISLFVFPKWTQINTSQVIDHIHL